MSNTVFCAAGTRVGEIFAEEYIAPWFWFLANITGVEHHYMIGAAEPRAAHVAPRVARGVAQVARGAPRVRVAVARGVDDEAGLEAGALLARQLGEQLCVPCG